MDWYYIIVFFTWDTINNYQIKNNDIIPIHIKPLLLETKYMTYICDIIKPINITDFYFFIFYIIINFKQSHKSIISNKIFPIKQNIICHTPNVIYKSTINLKSIGGPIKQYVGSTRYTVIQRATKTNREIRNGQIANGMANFSIHYCNENNINRESILTYITYEVLEVVKYTTYPILDEQLLFQAERKHILLNQTCMHKNNDIDSIGLNSWEDVEQASGMRKVAPAALKKAAKILTSKNEKKEEIQNAINIVKVIREQKMNASKPVYKRFDKWIKFYENIGITLSDPRKL